MNPNRARHASSEQTIKIFRRDCNVFIDHSEPHSLRLVIVWYIHDQLENGCAVELYMQHRRRVMSVL